MRINDEDEETNEKEKKFPDKKEASAQGWTRKVGGAGIKRKKFGQIQWKCTIYE